MATCNSCGAEIIWTITSSGKRMPMSVASKETRFVLRKHPDVPHAQSVDTYISHFADCPNAAQHRKPR